MEHKAYLHRSGRTARAGSSGDVVTVVLPEQRRDTDQLLRKANIQVRPQSVSSASAPIKDLVGDVAPYVKPTPKADSRPTQHRNAPRNPNARNPQQRNSGQQPGGRRRRNGQARPAR